MIYGNAQYSVLASKSLLVRAHFEHCWPLVNLGHGSYLGDGDVGLEALDFHIIWFDGQVCLAMRDVEGARGRALCLGQLVLLLACLALDTKPKQSQSATGSQSHFKSEADLVKLQR